MGQKVKSQLFQNMVLFAYQIKWNQEMQQPGKNILPTDPPPLGDGVNRSKFYFFQNMVMFRNKFKES